MNEVSHPSSNNNKVLLRVYYRELMEMQINEAASYDRVTLVANFGGMLGLMTGMSALSLFEIFIWILLCVVVCVR